MVLCCALFGATPLLPAAELHTIGPVRASGQGYGDAEVVLPELQWLVVAPHDFAGTAVQFTGGPFVHSQQPQFSVDCRLQLRVLRAAGQAPWVVGPSGDETHVARQDATAVVVASSQSSGAVILGLQATFVPQPGKTACAGEYVTQVVGLVTGL